MKILRSQQQTDEQLESETGPEVRSTAHMGTNMYAAQAGAESRALKQNVMFHYGNGALWRALLNNNFQMSG